MKLRILSCLIVALLAAATVAVPQQPPPQAAPVPIGNLSLNGVALDQVVNGLAQQLGLNLLIEAPLTGSVTLNTYGNPGNLDARNLLELLLRINGFGMVQEGDLYRVVELNQLRRAPISRTTDPNAIPEDDQMMLNLIFLKYITVTEMSTVLAEFSDNNTIIRSYQPANLLMILDSRRNMRRLMDLVEQFDSDMFANQRVRLYDIKNSLPSEIVKDLEDILKSISLNNELSTVRFLPVDRINLLIAVAPNPGAFDQVAEWLDKLDVPITSTSAIIDTYVYRVLYQRADCLAQALSQLYSPYPNYGGYGAAGGYPYPGAGGAYGANPYAAGYGGAYGPYAGFGGAGAFPGGGAYGGGGLGGGGGGYGSQNSFNQGFGGAGACGPYSSSAALGGLAYGYPAFNGFAAQTGVPGQAGVPGGLVGAGQPAPAATNGPPQIPPPRVVPHPLDNALLIQGNKQQYQAILKLLQELDRPPRQILLEAKIYSVSMTGAFSSGVEAYFQRVSGTQRQFTANLKGGLTSLSAGMLVGQSRELLGLLTLDENRSKARVISEPSLIATDSIPASINVGAQVPVLTGQTASPLQVGGTNAFTQGISSHNTGVTLQVNARVNPSGVVTLMINQEVSNPTPTTTSNIPTPSFDQQVVQTQITLQDGDTIAIGGIISENTVNSSNGIPGLSRIPVVGSLFGNRTTSSDRTELIIFMTPHVIYDTTQLLEASEELKRRLRDLRKYIIE